MVTRHVETMHDPGLGWLAGAGLGSAASQQINGIVSVGANTTVAMLAAFTTVLGPWGPAVAGLISVGSLIASMFQGCGQTCIVASQDANKFEVPLKQNLDHYMSAPVHYASIQAAALNNADTILKALRTACSDPALGVAGQHCISERLDPSACHWKNDGHGGAAGSGTVCWNWIVGYRNPIANDPSVVPDPDLNSLMVSTATGGGSSSSAGGGSPLTPGSFSLLDIALLGGGLLLLTMGGTSK